MYELFIARRYLKSKHKINFITIISVLSTLGITIGTAALIIVLSVFNGFGELVTGMMVSFDPHVRVTLRSEEAAAKLDSVEALLGNTEHVKAYQKYAEGKVILMHRNTVKILNLKGLDTEAEGIDWGVSTSIEKGEYDLENDTGPPKIIIGYPAMLEIARSVGDTLMATSFNNLEKMAYSYAMPGTRRFVVSAIFETKNKDNDNAYAFTSLKSAQRILGMGNHISGFDIRLDDIDNSDEVQKILESELDPAGFTVSTWYDFHKDLYDVMMLERWGAYILLALIILVASFNILSSLTMSVLEKKKDIGVLRAMGVNDKSILRIFMFKGLIIGVLGTLIGLLLGSIVVWLQQEYGFYRLDPMKYIIDAFPVIFRFTDVLAIAFVAILVSFLSSLYPAKRAVKIPVTDAIKWE